jgi:hypothetical protein
LARQDREKGGAGIRRNWVGNPYLKKGAKMKKALLILIIMLWPCLALAGEKIHLAWDSNTEPDVHSYKVYRSNNSPGNFVEIKSVPHRGTGVERFTDEVTGGHYWYCVKAVNSQGIKSGRSNIVDTSVK